MHLYGFTIELYYDARPNERQMLTEVLLQVTEKPHNNITHVATHAQTHIRRWSVAALYTPLTIGAEVTLGKTWLKSNFAQACTEYRIYTTNYICIYKGIQLESRLHRTGIYSSAAWPHRRLCYRPPVFFSLRSHPRKEKFGAHVSNFLYFTGKKNLLSLKLRNLKLIKSGNVYSSDLQEACKNISQVHIRYAGTTGVGKGKVIPLQPRCGPEGG